MKKDNSNKKARNTSQHRSFCNVVVLDLAIFLRHMHWQDFFKSLVGRKWMSLPTFEAIRAPKVTKSKTNLRNIETTNNMCCTFANILSHVTYDCTWHYCGRAPNGHRDVVETFKIQACQHRKSMATIVARLLGPLQPQKVSTI